MRCNLANCHFITFTATCDQFEKSKLKIVTAYTMKRQ